MVTTSFHYTAKCDFKNEIRQKSKFAKSTSPDDAMVSEQTYLPRKKFGGLV